MDPKTRLFKSIIIIFIKLSWYGAHGFPTYLSYNSYKALIDFKLNEIKMCD